MVNSARPLHLMHHIHRPWLCFKVTVPSYFWNWNCFSRSSSWSRSVFVCLFFPSHIGLVKKYTTIIKLTNLEGHVRAHNTQQTPIFVMTFYVTMTKMQVLLWVIYGLFFFSFFFKSRLTATYIYSHFRVQALHIHTLTLESNYTAHLSDQNSHSTGPESHTALTTPKTVLSLGTDVVLAKWSAITFAPWEQLHWRKSPRSSCLSGRRPSSDWTVMSFARLYPM